MRVAAWLVILATVLGGIAVFLPSLELRIAGAAVSRRTAVSLHKVARDRALIRKFLAAYHRSEQRKRADRLVHAVAPHVDGALSHKLGKLRDAFDDARDAMDTLDDTSDDDIRLATTIFTVTLYALLGLDAVLVLLVFLPLVAGQPRRGRAIFAIFVALVVAAIATALFLVCREAAWQANDEIGHSAVALTAFAYVLPAAAILGLLAAIVHAFRAR
ncbi:MAG TPA: hypothetical protein VFP84_23540 [Kofleriaceae bacterium]|nr:hypothetical protein [Kofleriaceae bacterium]